MASIDELLDALIEKCKKPEDLIGEHGLLKHLSVQAREQSRQAKIKEHYDFCVFHDRNKDEA